MEPVTETEPRASIPLAPLVLVTGDDEFAVKRRAREIFERWRATSAGLDLEVIDAEARTTAEAVNAMARLREAMQTLPLLGSSKVIWFRDCTFFSAERTGHPPAVVKFLNEFADTWRTFPWNEVRLLISASGIDRRLSFFETVEEIGHVEVLKGLSVKDKDWAIQAEEFVRGEFRSLNQQIDDEAIGAMVAAIGPNLRQLASEVEKVSLHAGKRSPVTVQDVSAIVSRRRQTQAFGLVEALGDRDLAAALRNLDEELWEIRADRSRSAVGLVQTLTGKVRAILLAKELQRAGFLKPGTSYAQFKIQLTRIPKDLFPEDPRCNPLKAHSYTLFRAAGQSSRFTADELVRAMGLLLNCNRRLVGTQLDEATILQQALVQIIGHGRRVSKRHGDMFSNPL